MIEATTIYNRAGVGHYWRVSPARADTVRSLCGLVDKLKHLDHDGVTARCKRCKAAHALLGNEGSVER